MTPPDPVTVLESIRANEAETSAALRDTPDWANERALYAVRLAALDTALAAVKLVQKFATLPVPDTTGDTCDELRALAEWIPEARALFPQEPR